MGNLFLPRVCQGPADVRRCFGIYRGAIVSIDKIDCLGTFFTSPGVCKILQKANWPNSDGDMQFWSCRTMLGQKSLPQHPRSDRGHGDGQSSMTRRQQRTSSMGSLETGTPRCFLRGDMGDPAAAARSDFFPSQDERQRTMLEGAASAS